MARSAIRSPHSNSALFQPVPTPHQQFPPPQSSSAAALLQSPRFVLPAAVKSPASKILAHESSPPVAATPHSQRLRRSAQFPSPPATQKWSALPPRSTPPAPLHALPPI